MAEKMDYDTKQVLQGLSKEPSNKSCFDCSSPVTGWASVSFGIYICLNCSGQHRALGVHVSFIRSISMDKWSDAQVNKMRIGGNEKVRAFFEAAPEYRSDMSISEKYNAHFATLYREKLAAEAEGKVWDPSMTPPPSATASAVGLRKPRAATSGRTSPGSLSGQSTPVDPGNGLSSKAVVDTNYFSSLGSANASRPENLRPSEGGRYGGFGSEGSFSPSGSSSQNALSLDDFKGDPVGALSKGWGFFSSALSQATKQVNETVIQPSVQRATDPTLQTQITGYASSAANFLGSTAKVGAAHLGGAMRSGGELAKRELGVDVGDMGASYIEKISGTRSGAGYAPVGSNQARHRQEATQADFFDSHLTSQPDTSSLAYSDTPNGGIKPEAVAEPFAAKAASKKDDDDDGWGEW